MGKHVRLTPKAIIASRNAKIAGLPASLHMQGNSYNIAVTVFTVAYIVFGMPANLLMKRLGPRTLAVYMFAWGMNQK